MVTSNGSLVDSALTTTPNGGEIRCEKEEPGNTRPRRVGGRERAATSRRHREIPELVDTRRAAEILSRSPDTLKQWRYQGIGPAYTKNGGVRYDVRVLIEFIEKHTRVPSVRAAMEETREAV